MKLNRGINLGGFLSQCVHTKEHYESFILENDIKIIKDAGFDHVRVPVDYNVFEDEDGSVNDYGYALLDKVISWTRKYGLDVVLDLHKAYGYDFNDAGTEKNDLFGNPELQERFLKLWENIARHYGNQEDIALELLNEVVEKENIDGWNSLIDRAVDRIRAIAKDTYIIYGGIMWSSIRTMKYLKKPKDDKIILTFHFYEPLLFTHQKAHWMDTMDKTRDIQYPADMELYRKYAADAGIQGEVVKESSLETMDINYIRELIEAGIKTAKEMDAPIYCGEFGVIDQAPVKDAVNWFMDMSQVFKENNIGCALWTYKQMDFGIFGEDSHFNEFHDDIVNALLK